MAMDNVKDFIFDYARYMHLSQMPDTVRARFADYEKNKDFAGNMKQWPDILQNINAGVWPELEDAKIEDLYKLFQPVLEYMAQSVDKDRSVPKAVKTFVNEWYGTNKLFTQSEPDSATKARINDFAKYLEDNHDTLKGLFTDKTIGEGFKFDKFVQDIKSQKYLNDFELRKQLKSVATYIQNVASGSTWYDWPQNLRPYDFSKPSNGLPAISTDVDEWFVSKYNPAFKYRLPEIFGKLVGNKKVFEYFQSKDSKGTISKNITEAIEKTNYADEKSDDYVPEKDSDEKNIFQRIDDKLNKIKENQIDPWAKMLRGTRRFFTPHAKSIIEACSKVKTKEGKPLAPTDGLKGLLDNKEAIEKKIHTSPTARTHWKWISGKLAKYSESVPKAFEGALRNPKQMRKIVSKFIIDAAQEGKIDEAKTALEMISTLKYGIAHSRTVDALAKEEFKPLSDLSVSKKYEAMGVLAKSLEKATKYTLLGAARGVVAVRNKWMRDNTKFRGKDGFLKSAHGLWQGKNDKNKYQTDVHNKISADLDAARTDYAAKRTALLTAGGERWLPDAKQNIQTKISDLQDSQSAKSQEYAVKNNILQQRRETLGSNPDAYRAQLSDAITQLGNELDQLRNERSSKEQELIKTQNDIQTWSDKLEAMDPTDPTFAGVAGYKLALENKLATLQGEIAQLDSNIDSTETNKSEKEQQQDELSQSALYDLETKINNLGTDIDVLKADIASRQKILDDFDIANNNVKSLVQQKHATQGAVDGWDDGHKDEYMELMAYWDMLESYWKSHQFTFAADRMRKKFITSGKAEQVSAEFLAKYKQKYAA